MVVIIDQNEIPVKVTFHPAYLLRNPYEKKKCGMTY